HIKHTNKYIQTVTIIRYANVIFSLIYPSSIICVLYPDKYNPFSGCIAATILNAPNIITNNVIAKIIIRLILNILYSLFVILVSFIISANSFNLLRTHPCKRYPFREVGEKEYEQMVQEVKDKASNGEEDVSSLEKEIKEKDSKDSDDYTEDSLSFPTIDLDS